MQIYSPPLTQNNSSKEMSPTILRGLISELELCFEVSRLCLASMSQPPGQAQVPFPSDEYGVCQNRQSPCI